MLTEPGDFSRKVIDASTLGIIVYQSNGRCVLANEAAAAILGGGVEALLQQNFREIQSWRAAGLVEKAEAALHKGCTQHGEANITTSFGKNVWLKYSYSCFQNEGVDHLLMVFDDITYRKRIEEQLVQKNRDMETMLYITSHDLREPLRSIQNFSKLVAQRYADRLDEKGQDFLNRVVNGGRRMEGLIDDLLQLSRAQRLIKPEEILNGKTIVEEALKNLEARIAETGAVLRIEGKFPEIQVDRTWAVQAVYNLIANAIKFTEEGRRPQIEISPYVSNDKKQAGLIVKDRGTGVDEEASERIFELFKRNVGREISGSGAGLAIVREVAERHGGAAWVRARTGGGSEFFITFGSKESLKGKKHGLYKAD